MNARERRTIRIGVAIGTIVGLMGCSGRSSDSRGTRQTAAVSSLNGEGASADQRAIERAGAPEFRPVTPG